MTTSTGFIERIVNGVAWGRFINGPLAGNTLDVPCLFRDENNTFNITVGDEILKTDPDGNSYIIVKDNMALVFNAIQTDNGWEIERFAIIRKLH